MLKVIGSSASHWLVYPFISKNYWKCESVFLFLQIHTRTCVCVSSVRFLLWIYRAVLRFRKAMENHTLARIPRPLVCSEVTRFFFFTWSSRVALHPRALQQTSQTAALFFSLSLSLFSSFDIDLFVLSSITQQRSTVASSFFSFSSSTSSPSSLFVIRQMWTGPRGPPPRQSTILFSSLSLLLLLSSVFRPAGRLIGPIKKENTFYWFLFVSHIVSFFANIFCLY